MGTNAYELLASAMRYVFAALMVLIVIRGTRITLVDRARAARLRRLSPETGLIGEVLVVHGEGRVHTGDSYPITLEGTIGCVSGCDIRVRSSTVRRRHAIYQMTKDGLYIRGHAGARIYDRHRRAHRELMLHDGDVFGVGGVMLMLVLSDADSAPEQLERKVHRRRDEHAAAYRDGNRLPARDDRSGLYDTDAKRSDPDDFFLSNPAAGTIGRVRTDDDRDAPRRDPYDRSVDDYDMDETNDPNGLFGPDDDYDE